jgi:hypothetical protein
MQSLPTCGVAIMATKITTRLISEQSTNLKFKQQKKACFEAKSVSIKNDLALIFLFEEIDTLKRLLKAKKNVGSKKRKAESLLSKAKEEVFLGK